MKIDIDYHHLAKHVTNEAVEGKIYVRNDEFILFSNSPTSDANREFQSADSIDINELTMSLSFQTGYESWEILIYADEVPLWTILFENKKILLIMLLNVLLPTMLIYIVGKS